MPTAISGTQGVDKVKDGAVGTAALAPGATTPEKSSGFPFTKEYVSPEQTITLTGALTLAHGLGVKPKVIDYHLVCKTAEAGYSVGDEVKLVGANYYTAGGSASGISVILNETNLIIRYGNAPYFLINAATGAAVQLTSANWRLVVRAWA